MEDLIANFSISKLLSLGIVGGSLILKVPQILKIVSNKSVAGLNFFSFFLEAVVYSIVISYHYQNGYPFMTYGEAVFIIIQLWVILYLILSYTKKLADPKSLGLLVAYLAFFAFMLSHLSSLWLVQTLQSGSTLIVIASRLPQIRDNYDNHSVGQLSPITVLLQLGGSLARVYTTLKDVNDFTVLLGYGVGATLNLILMLQCLFYGGAPSKKKE